MGYDRAMMYGEFQGGPVSPTMRCIRVRTYDALRMMINHRRCTCCHKNCKKLKTFLAIVSKQIKAIVTDARFRMQLLLVRVLYAALIITT